MQFTFRSVRLSIHQLFMRASASSDESSRQEARVQHHSLACLRSFNNFFSLRRGASLILIVVCCCSVIIQATRRGKFTDYCDLKLKILLIRLLFSLALEKQTIQSFSRDLSLYHVIYSQNGSSFQSVADFPQRDGGGNLFELIAFIEIYKNCFAHTLNASRGELEKRNNSQERSVYKEVSAPRSVKSENYI